MLWHVYALPNGLGEDHICRLCTLKGSSLYRWQRTHGWFIFCWAQPTYCPPWFPTLSGHKYSLSFFVMGYLIMVIYIYRAITLFYCVIYIYIYDYMPSFIGCIMFSIASVARFIHGPCYTPLARCLPLAHVVNHDVFVTHGGLPRSGRRGGHGGVHDNSGSTVDWWYIIYTVIYIVFDYFKWLFDSLVVI